MRIIQGQPIAQKDAEGALCLKNPWPGMARTVYGDHKRFLETYFKPYPGIKEAKWVCHPTKLSIVMLIEM
jgi:acyl-coenzyme A synthetase/AMP-(fatty) acid ligase